MPDNHLILVVEDEPVIGAFICNILKSNGYQSLITGSGKEAYALLTSRCPDLVMLDLGLPDMNGLTFIRDVRAWSSIPIIVVSGLTHERDKVISLDCGADDYITKPFGTSELLARVRAALRHAAASLRSGGLTGTFRSGDLTVDYDKMRVYVGGKDARLTQREYRIVSLLSQYAGKVLTYNAIIKELWGGSASGSNQILRVNMVNIRRKIEQNPSDPRYILTETGVGYRMAESD